MSEPVPAPPEQSTSPTPEPIGNRRAFSPVPYVVLAALVLVGVLIVVFVSRRPEKETPDDIQWRGQLTEMQYYVTRLKGTEPAWTGKYLNNKRTGVYVCVCCQAPLFDSSTKYDSRSGWPSFWAPINDTNVGEKQDNSHFMIRTEVICNECDAHLGHVFPDGPDPTGLRYCINSAALNFQEGGSSNEANPSAASE